MFGPQSFTSLPLHKAAPLKRRTSLRLLNSFNFNVNFILFGIKCSLHGFILARITCIGHLYALVVVSAESFLQLPGDVLWCIAVYASVLLLEFNFMSVSELLSKKKRGGKRRWSSGDIMKLRIKTEWNKNRVLLVKLLLIRLMQFLLSARGLISQCYNNFQGLYWSN